ncbi:MAG: amidohydrolase family protein, partial [Dehalococcoidia bacterium]
AGTAEALQLSDQIGSLKPGLQADIAVFDGDPAQNIREMDRASTVLQGGKIIKLQDEVLV